MALTLTEGENYSTTSLQRAVIDRLAKSDPILERLPFVQVLGNSLTYDTITTRSGAAFYEVGDTWNESTVALTQATAKLKILGGDADVDNFLLKTRVNGPDLKGTVIDDKIRAIKEAFMDCFFYGSNSADAKKFDGLQTLMTSTTYNTIHAGSGTGTALSMLKLRQAADLIVGHSPAYIVMTKTMRQYIDVYLNSIGSAFPRGADQWGRPLPMFDGIPVLTSDSLLNTETAASGAYTAKTGGANTSIFILSLDGEQSCCGLHAGAAGPEVEPLGNLETKDATRYRIKWYVSLMFQDLRSCAKVDGIVAAGTVTA